MLDLLKEESAITEPLRFDYDQIATEYREHVIDATVSIRRHARRAQEDMIAMGKRLLEVKGLLPHGQFEQWIGAEFDLSIRTAQNLMNVAQEFEGKNETVSLLSNSVLYMLAAPSTPESAREQAIAEAQQTGKSPTKARVKGIIAGHRQDTSARAGLDAMNENLRSEMAKANRPTGKCGVCGRPLSDPAHIAQGCGPVCAAKQAAVIDPPALPDFEDDLIILIECPRCGAQQQDFDGFGVVHCPACGYCTHPSATDGTCDICGEPTATEPEAELTPHQKRMAGIRAEDEFWREAMRRLNRIGDLTGVYVHTAPLRRAIEPVLELLARSVVIGLLVWLPLVMDGTGKTSSVARDGPGQPVCEVHG